MKMRRYVVTIAMVFVAGVLVAQDMTSKKGVFILPAAGDIAIGFDALPLLRYVGTIGTGNNTDPSADFTFGDQTIYGKYFIEDAMAIRGMVRIGFGSTTKTNYVQDDEAVFINASSNATRLDEMTATYNNITLGGGLEMRRGHGRVQGYYGGELLLSFGGGGTSYAYGNRFSDDYAATYTDDFDLLTISSGNVRLKDTEDGTMLGVTARGFLGVEYFFAPKISVGAEYGWGIGYESIGEGSSRVEWWGFASDSSLVPSTNTTTTKTGKTSTFGIDTDNSGGAIRLLFHF